MNNTLKERVPFPRAWHLLCDSAMCLYGHETLLAAIKAENPSADETDFAVEVERRLRQHGITNRSGGLPPANGSASAQRPEPPAPRRKTPPPPRAGLSPDLAERIALALWSTVMRPANANPETTVIEIARAPAAGTFCVQGRRPSANQSSPFTAMELLIQLQETRREAAHNAIWMLAAAWFVKDVTDVRRAIRNHRIPCQGPHAPRLYWTAAYGAKAHRTLPIAKATESLWRTLLAFHPHDPALLREADGKRAATAAFTALASLQQGITFDPQPRRWIFSW